MTVVQQSLFECRTKLFNGNAITPASTVPGVTIGLLTTFSSKCGSAIAPPSFVRFRHGS
jgi:hypothetical protein